MHHLVIDLETLATTDDAVILQISAGLYDTAKKRAESGVEFLLEDIKLVNYKLDAKAQKNRRVSRDTLDWWKKQDIEVQRASLIPHPEDLPPEEALDDFALFLSRNGFNKKNCVVWQRGSKDSDWLCSLMFDFGWTDMKSLPFDWWCVRDVRTAVDVLGQSEKLNGYPDYIKELEDSIPGYKHHDAISDVKMEFCILRGCGIL